MKLMVVGSGGREHALGWKLASSGQVDDILFVPGNGGMSELGECVTADVNDAAAVAAIARERAVDLTVVGPEAPLVDGLVDHLEDNGLKAFGPTREAARLEGSKQFAKSVMEKYGVPTGRARLFDDFDEARAYVESQSPPVVVKADGLAAGKGVIIASTTSEAVDALNLCMVDKAFGASGGKVLIEEYMEGPEVSILSLTDGETAAHMVPSQDHKRVFDGDEGPNTGGMGAYSPVPLLNAATEQAIHHSVMEATIDGMRDEMIPYRGVLYGGLMLTADGFKTLEFNVRFGDPETQVVLPRLSSDLLPGLLATMDGNVRNLQMRWSDEYCVVVALGRDFEEARCLAYQSVEMIDFEGKHYRTDIGYRAIEWQREHGL